MAFQVRPRGKLTSSYRAERPGFSFVVTEARPDGDLRGHLAGLTGGESAARNLGLPNTGTMDPEREIPRIFQTWEAWLREAGVCGSIAELDFVETRVFGCQPKSPRPWVDPAGHAAETQRLRAASARADAAYFRDHLPDHGLPVRFTVHVVDIPGPVASCEFDTSALRQRRAGTSQP